LTDKIDANKKNSNNSTGTNLLNLAFFGLYEIFVNVLPGMVILATLNLFIGFNFFSSISTFSEATTQFTLFSFAAFIIGFTLQGITKLLTKCYTFICNKPKDEECQNLFKSDCCTDREKKCSIGKKTSATYLDEKSPGFSKTLTKAIRAKAANVIDAPLSEADWQTVTGRHLFDICHAYLVQENADSKIQIYQRMYGLAKSMIAAMFVIHIPLWLWVINNPNTLTILIGIVTSLFLILMSYVFYLLYESYDKAFVKEVLNTFLVVNKFI
jgi:hypothetical protein